LNAIKTLEAMIAEVAKPTMRKSSILVVRTVEKTLEKVTDLNQSQSI
jgi:hypothetical protein